MPPTPFKIIKGKKIFLEKVFTESKPKFGPRKFKFRLPEKSQEDSDFQKKIKKNQRLGMR